MGSRFQKDFDRRDFLRFTAAGALGLSGSGWLPRLARAAAESGQSKPRACILLWMNGGPSQTDTFDLKPGHENGGTYKPIQTAAQGVQISEHLPQLAKQFQDLAIVRSLTTTEGDHGRATQLALTGYRPRGAAVNYPVLGSLLAHELGSPDNVLPNFVSIAPVRFANLGAGFLGPAYAPLTVSGQSNDPQARANLSIENLKPNRDLSSEAMEERFKLFDFFSGEFEAKHKTDSAAAHEATYEKAFRMVRTQAKHAFKLDEESDALRDAYGRNRFGQGCLLARRLVERGVPFVEVSLAQTPQNQIGWDTHGDNFTRVRQNCEILDPAWATLMSDLRERGLLDSTLVIWMGEFGRTPVINDNGGRDHFPLAWSMVLGGAGIEGGRTVGDTGPGGTEVVDRPVTMPELYATFCAAVGVDHTKENISRQGRPIALVDGDAEPVRELIQAKNVKKVKS